MKLFKNLRFGRKKKLEEVSKRYENDVLAGSGKWDVSTAKKYILEGCEQLTKDVQELVDDRNEYRSLTNYLTDIQLIENLNTADRDKINDVANNILSLTENKNASLEITKKMPDSQFMDMQKYQEEVPEAIVRLKENEKNQEILKKDIDYLEGEKLEWTYEGNVLTVEIHRLKKVVYYLVGFFVMLALFFAIMKAAVQMDAGIYGILILAIVLIATLAILLRILNDKTIIKQSQVNYNAAVTLQNRIKLRYVNATNAVEYVREKYHVSSAQDFQKQWDTYLDICAEKERLERTNDDLEYYKEVLVKILRKYQLYDAGIWAYQAQALVEPREMVEIKHSLLERRTKIRKRIEFLTENLQNKQGEINRVANEQNLMTDDVNAILNSVERALNPTKNN